MKMKQTLQLTRLPVMGGLVFFALFNLMCIASDHVLNCLFDYRCFIFNNLLVLNVLQIVPAVLS